MSQEIIAVHNEDTLPNENARVAIIDRAKFSIDVPVLLGHLAQYTNLAGIIHNIKKGTRYVVQIPTQLQAAVDAGQYTMLQSVESGKTWATIVEKLSNGKNEFVANCPIKAEAFYQGNPIQDLSASFANLQLQQQMANIAQMIGETYDAIIRVEAGQKADRIGQLIAGRNGIIHALQMQDEESRKHQIVIERGRLQEAQGKIGEVIKQKITAFEALPKSAFARFLRECKPGSYLDKKDDEYNSIQEYYELYMQATKLLADSYIICGEKQSAVSVFEMCKQFIEDMDFSSIKTIVYSHPDHSEKDLFFHEAAKYLEKEKVSCFALAKPCEYVEFTVDGQEIWEVLTSEK